LVQRKPKPSTDYHTPTELAAFPRTPYCLCNKNSKTVTKAWWLKPVILAMWEAEIGRIVVQDQSRQIVCKTPISKTNNNNKPKNRAK
jgi:hypothetical protein